MPHFTRLDVYNTMLETGFTPIFYNGDGEVARKIVSACAEGGALTIEYMNRGDFAPHVFGELVRYAAGSYPRLVLGVGSIIDPHTAAIYIANGADFVVGQSFNREVALLCNRRKVAYLPGCATPTEIAEAEEVGVEIIKLFPATSMNGPAFVKAMLGPSPWSRIMPTSGVDATEESITAWFRAGVSCVGLGSSLIREDLVALGDFRAITDLTRRVAGWIRQARGG